MCWDSQKEFQLCIWTIQLPNSHSEHRGYSIYYRGAMGLNVISLGENSHNTLMVVQSHLTQFSSGLYHSRNYQFKTNVSTLSLTLFLAHIGICIYTIVSLWDRRRRLYVCMYVCMSVHCDNLKKTAACMAMIFGV